MVRRCEGWRSLYKSAWTTSVDGSQSRRSVHFKLKETERYSGLVGSTAKAAPQSGRSLNLGPAGRIPSRVPTPSSGENRNRGFEKEDAKCQCRVRKQGVAGHEQRGASLQQVHRVWGSKHSGCLSRECSWYSPCTARGGKDAWQRGEDLQRSISSPSLPLSRSSSAVGEFASLASRTAAHSPRSRPVKGVSSCSASGPSRKPPLRAYAARLATHACESSPDSSRRGEIVAIGLRRWRTRIRSGRLGGGGFALEILDACGLDWTCRQLSVRKLFCLARREGRSGRTTLRSAC